MEALNTDLHMIAVWKVWPKWYVEQRRFRQLFLLACLFVRLKKGQNKNQQPKSHAPHPPNKKKN